MLAESPKALGLVLVPCRGPCLRFRVRHPRSIFFFVLASGGAVQLDEGHWRQPDARRRLLHRRQGPPGTQGVHAHARMPHGTYGMYELTDQRTPTQSLVMVAHDAAVCMHAAALQIHTSRGRNSPVYGMQYASLSQFGVKPPWFVGPLVVTHRKYAL